MHSGEELFFCLPGKLGFLIGGERYCLRRGDSMHFKSEQPHVWYNRGPGDARVICCLTPLAAAPEIRAV